MSATVLIIDDEEAIAWALRKACERQGYHVAVAASAEAGLAEAHRHPPDVVLLDIRLPGMDGLTAMTRLAALAPDTAVIIMTAHGNLDTAVRAVAGGAFDYLAKPFDLQTGLDVVQRAVTRPRTNDLPRSTEPLGRSDALIGQSPAMQAIFKRIALVAPTDACVLITGESGTGKDVVARAIHAHSRRRDRPLLPVHIAALNPNLVESELFGHTRGAFTGADRSRPGLLALADGGTVFLDELADIPLPVQAKLLRVVERQELLPVGGTEPQRVDVRIVSATHADLPAAIAAGRFRHDLYYRLNVYPIELPPLRQRIEDLPVLAEHFLRRLGANPTLPAETLHALRSRRWTGNIRELRNALEHAAILARGSPIRPEWLPTERLDLAKLDSTTDRLSAAVREWVQRHLAQPSPPTELYQQFLNTVEPILFTEVLQKYKGNRLATARHLGLARATLRKWLQKYHLDSASDDVAGTEDDMTREPPDEAAS